MAHAIAAQAPDRPARARKIRKRRSLRVGPTRPEIPDFAYRGQHGALESDDRPTIARYTDRDGREARIPDGQGGYGSPLRAFDTLAALIRRGSITIEAHDAGRSFEETFGRACLDPLKAADLSRIKIDGQESGDLPVYICRARERIHRAIAHVGGLASPSGAAAWHVIGLGETIKAWANGCQYNAGKSLDERAARGILIGTLSALAGFYNGAKS